MTFSNADTSSYTETVPQVFFPAAGYRDNTDGDAYGRGHNGRYWSSRPFSFYTFYTAYYLRFYDGNADMDDFRNDRANGLSVRCVQE